MQKIWPLRLWAGRFPPKSYRTRFQMIAFICPTCQKTFRVKEELVGKKVKCSGCGQIMQLPSPPTSVVVPSSNKALTGVPPNAEHLRLTPITELIPGHLRHVLFPNEQVFHFEWLDSVGGCGSHQSSTQYMIITNLRIIYEAKIRDPQSTEVQYLRTSGSLPLSKVSFVGTQSSKSDGCNAFHSHVLTINSAGGSIEFPFLNENKSKRVQRVIEELLVRP